MYSVIIHKRGFHISLLSSNSNNRAIEHSSSSTTAFAFTKNPSELRNILPKALLFITEYLNSANGLVCTCLNASLSHAN